MKFPAMRVGSILLALAASLLARADSLDNGMPITIDDEWNLDRENETVSLLVPIREGAAITSTAQLKMLDGLQQEIPVQWKVLTRWRGTPADSTVPIRFALARFRLSLAGTATMTCFLHRRQPGDPLPPGFVDPIVYESNGTKLVIDTSAARYEFDLTKSALFGDVMVDLNKDGEYDPHGGEKIVVAGQSLGAVLMDVYSGLYMSAADTQPIATFEEVGPLYTILRIDSKHMPVGVGNMGRDYFTCTTRYTFTAGSPAVRVEQTIQNSYLTNPLGAMTFGRYLLHTKLATNDEVRVSFGGDGFQPTGASIPLPPPVEAFLLQDSIGGTYWNQPGTTFEGWRMYATTPTGLKPETLPLEAPIASGMRSSGWMNVQSPGRGLFVALRYPWQNYPYALRSYFDGTMVIDLLPSEYHGNHFLDDGQRKTWELVFIPHDGTLDPVVAAKKHQQPLRARPPMDFLQESRAWGDLGDIREPSFSKSEMVEQGKKELAIFNANLEQKGAYGWQNFGEYTWAKSTHATGSPRNRLTWFDRFMTCGGYAWFERVETFVLHSMDLRTYHIDGFKTEEHPNAILGEGLPGWPGTDMLGRDSIPANLSPYKFGIPTGGSGWNGFDGEHMMVDDLYEYYLLTGSPRALDSLKAIGEGILSWKHIIDLNKPIASSRFIGWVLRALLKIYAVTGDARMKGAADKIVLIADKFRGKTPSPLTGKVYNYLARAIYGGGSHNMDEDYDCPWQIGVGMYGLAYYYVETGDPLALKMIQDLNKFIVYFCVKNNVVVEAIACDNHYDINPKNKNDGVNIWLTSALAIGFRYSGNTKSWQVGNLIFDQNQNSFMTAGDNYHWHHVAGIVFGKQ